MIAIIFFWLLFALVVGIVASGRGRSGFGWFILACLISPLLAGIFLLVSANLATKAERPNPSTHVKCPDCAELVLAEAKVCKHCGCKLVPVSQQKDAAGAPVKLPPPKYEPSGWMMLFLIGVVVAVIYIAK
ncbi:hypothetical protein [Achromobacter sp. ACRQX]|uniref:hypothetical protein n=1 Tax=Achromobacter sp. ACRQX TaxID=2918181 RepID=UPI001EF30068|nr:hypothetical protein [Achromobacter sp. ACRQX]MCG7328031.1 hypothetical protein [Achromobacter sp. ACRQX]